MDDASRLYVFVVLIATITAIGFFLVRPRFDHWIFHLMVRRDLKKLGKRKNQAAQRISETRRELRAAESWQGEALEVLEVLNLARHEELMTLREILGTKRKEPSKLLLLIRKSGSHTVASMWRKLRKKGDYVRYEEVLLDVANTVKARASKAQKIPEIEQAIISKTFDQAISNLDEDALKEYKANLMKEAAKYGLFSELSAPVTAALVVGMGKASGFGLYIMASTVVGALTHAVGVTFPFVFYTTMSSTISLLMGPVGIGLLGLWGIHKLAAPDKEKTVASVILVGAIRSRLELDRRQKIKELNKQLQKREGLIESINSRIVELQAQLKK